MTDRGCGELAEPGWTQLSPSLAWPRQQPAASAGWENSRAQHKYTGSDVTYPGTNCVLLLINVIDMWLLKRIMKKAVILSSNKCGRDELTMIPRI